MSNFAKAKDHFKARYFDPALELMDAATVAVQDAERRAIQAEATLEALRPVWAQGWSSDSEAAQASANALSELWQVLGVENQTAAMDTLRELKSRAR